MHKILANNYHAITALEARHHAGAFISGFQVGCRIVTVNGAVYDGANIESADIRHTLHAEEIALARAITAEGPSIQILRSYVSGAPKGQLVENPVTSCGNCRQTQLEFPRNGLEIHSIFGEGATIQDQVATDREMLPEAFVFNPSSGQPTTPANVLPLKVALSRDSRAEVEICRDYLPHSDNRHLDQRKSVLVITNQDNAYPGVEVQQCAYHFISAIANAMGNFIFSSAQQESVSRIVVTYEELGKQTIRGFVASLQSYILNNELTANTQFTTTVSESEKIIIFKFTTPRGTKRKR